MSEKSETPCRKLKTIFIFCTKSAKKIRGAESLEQVQYHQQAGYNVQSVCKDSIGQFSK